MKISYILSEYMFKPAVYPIECDLLRDISYYGDCIYCDFYGNKTICGIAIKDWANSEFKEREIDWSKVPVDTPILITYSCYTLKRHFAKYYNKTIYFYPDGTTSWSFNQDSSQLISWDEKNVQIEKGIDCSEWYKD